MKSIIIPVILFSFSMSITPGPNNIMVTASGAKFGFKRTFPHIIGIILGMSFLYVLCAAGLGAVFFSFPFLKTLLKIAGSVYLVYLAFKIIFSKKAENKIESGYPLKIHQAAAFQLLNPKALMIPITAISAYTLNGELYVASVAFIILTFIITGTACVSVWAAFGTVIGRMLKNGKAFRVFNIFLGILTGATVLMILK
ncbi:MAG: LysE family translocator [Spirochaetes bacterium]|nr:LysE family translocator [Spirochaetota bacterium]